MARNAYTSVRSRQVAGQLRHLREVAGLSCADVAAKMGMSASKISRIETGNSRLQPDDVSSILGLYDVPAEKRTQLMELVRKNGERGWWERQPGLPHLWRTLIDLEAKAARIENYESMFVPGLLQTAEYARAVISGAAPALSETEVDNLVASRMARQALLTRRNAPELVAVLDEGVVRREVGEPGVLIRQLRQLADFAQRPHIRLQVVPYSAGVHPGWQGPFMLQEFEDDPAFVYVESQTTCMFLDSEPDLTAYRLAMRNILDVALSPEQTMDLISEGT
jgi:transcriptional regulator with XRE-family HTH domain